MSVRKERNPLLSALMIMAFCFVSFLGFVGFLAWNFKGEANFSFDGRGSLKGDVAVVEVEGVILDVKPTLKLLKRLEKEEDVRSVVVRIDSPGGAVGPSQELFEALKRLDQKKPVVASLGTVAASGGYYTALGARKIVSNPGTLTGSIGVIMEFADLSELFKWAKMSPYLIKGGKYKDIGNPNRQMTAEEKELLQTTVNDVHRQFKEAVAKRRDLPMPVVDQLADGRVYSGRQALEAKLVDELGGLEVAIGIAAKLAGVEGDDLKVVYPPKEMRLYFEKFFEGIFRGAAKGMAPIVKETLQGQSMR